MLITIKQYQFWQKINILPIWVLSTAYLRSRAQCAPTPKLFSIPPKFICSSCMCRFAPFLFCLVPFSVKISFEKEIISFCISMGWGRDHPPLLTNQEFSKTKCSIDLRLVCKVCCSCVEKNRVLYLSRFNYGGPTKWKLSYEWAGILESLEWLRTDFMLSLATKMLVKGCKIFINVGAELQ